MLSCRILAWLENTLGTLPAKILPLAGDASFRQYYRLYLSQNHSVILMVASQEKASNASFLKIGEVLDEWGVHVPQRIAVEEDLGTLLLSDMGDLTLASQLNKTNEFTLYKQALLTLKSIQKVPYEAIKGKSLPAFFDKSFMMTEMDYLSQWLLGALLGVKLSAKEQRQLEDNFAFIAEQVGHQPFVFIHRDYHSRNLMVLPKDELGVLDFQDATWGPLTYDVVSLLRDCYYVIAPTMLDSLLHVYHEQCSGMSLDFKELKQWFTITTVQRHVKVAGIFARLACRDGKKQFIKDIPVALSYLRENLPYYEELGFLNQLLNECIEPRLEQGSLV